MTEDMIKIPVIIVGDDDWGSHCEALLGKENYFRKSRVEKLCDLNSKCERGKTNYVFFSPFSGPKDGLEFQSLGLNYPFCKFFISGGNEDDWMKSSLDLIKLDTKNDWDKVILQMALADGPVFSNSQFQDYYSFRNYISGKVIHDLNNRFLAMSGGLQMLKMQLQSNPDVSNSIDLIKSQNDKAVDLTLQLRELNERQFSKELGPYFYDTLKDCLHFWSNRWPHQTIRVSVSDDLNGLISQGDNRQLWVVLSVLIENSFEAIDSKSSGEVGVNVRIVNTTEDKDILFGKYQDGPVLEIEISDTGVGMPIDDPQMLFDSEFTTKGEGRGFSLSVVKNYCQQNGRYLSFSSNVAELKGARFTIGLPFDSE